MELRFNPVALERSSSEVSAYPARQNWTIAASSTMSTSNCFFPAIPHAPRS
jgi:hypothetical protein